MSGIPSTDEDTHWDGGKPSRCYILCPKPDDDEDDDDDI